MKKKFSECLCRKKCISNILEISKVRRNWIEFTNEELSLRQKLTFGGTTLRCYSSRLISFITIIKLYQNSPFNQTCTEKCPKSQVNELVRPNWHKRARSRFSHVSFDWIRLPSSFWYGNRATNSDERENVSVIKMWSTAFWLLSFRGEKTVAAEVNYE